MLLIDSRPSYTCISRGSAFETEVTTFETVYDALQSKILHVGYQELSTRGGTKRHTPNQSRGRAAKFSQAGRNNANEAAPY